MDYVLSTGTSSCSHTYGNVVEAVKMDILSKFPMDYFRYIHVSSKLAFRDMKQYKDNSLVEFRKQERPKIYIKPNFEVTDDSVPFFGTNLVTHMSSTNGTISKLSLMPIVRDERNHVELDFRMNRDRITFDVNIQVETLVRQLDLYQNLMNMVLWNGPHIRIFSLESMIPKVMIQYLVRNAGITLDESSKSIPVVVGYLQLHGLYPITYKIRNSSSLDEFFMYYEVPAIVTYSDLQIDEGQKKGMVDDQYGLNFRVTCEFNHPGAYLLRSINGYPKVVPVDMKIVDSGDSDELIPLYTLDHLYAKDVVRPDGFKRYVVTSFRSDKENDGKEDSIDLTDIIEVPYMRILKKYVFSHIPTDVLIRSEIYADKKQLVDGEDYYIDWNLMKLTILQSNPYVTYRIILYANTMKFNEEFQTLLELNKRDKTYENLENPVVRNDIWRDRENQLLIDANGDYYMPKIVEAGNVTKFADGRKESDFTS